MVNETQNTKQKILALLVKAGSATLSGVRISEETGISRVAVWKHIKALKSEGIPIVSTPKGYTIESADDLMLPDYFRDDLRDRIFYYPEVETTMDTAKTLAREGAPHMSCCIAEHQSRGRGRMNREWVSDAGGLWFTLILKPDVPPPMAYAFNFAAGLSLSRVIRRTLNLDASVKWPNDLLLEGKKLVGLLSEMETRGDMIRHLLIGIGVNVNNDPTNDTFEATSLKNVLGKSVSRRELLTDFIDDFTARTRNLAAPNAIPELITRWKTCTSTIGSHVRVETLNDTITGIARDVDDSGTLIVETETGRIKPIIYGDCFHT